MRKIISKIDCMIQEKGLLESKELWNKIKDREFIINEAKRIVKMQNGKDTFFAPSIIYMVITNKEEILEKTYNEIIKTIVENSDISRTIIDGDMTFLDVILSHDQDTINQNYLKSTKQELINRRYHTNFNYINYIHVPENTNVVSCSFNNLEIGINEEELQKFEKFEHFSVDESNESYHITNYLNLEDEKANLDGQDELTKILTVNNLFRKNNKFNKHNR